MAFLLAQLASAQKVLDTIEFNGVRYEVVELTLENLRLEDNRATFSSVTNSAIDAGFTLVPVELAQEWRNKKTWLSWPETEYVVGTKATLVGPREDLRYALILRSFCDDCVFPVSGTLTGGREYSVAFFAPKTPWVFLRKARASF